MTAKIESRFKPLFEPIKINKVKLKNRIVMGPMGLSVPTAEGAPSDQAIAFYEARARGGTGMIIISAAATARSADEAPPTTPWLRWDIEENVPKFQKLAEAIHAFETPVVIELMSSFGRLGMPKTMNKIAASPKELTIPEDHFPKGFVIPGGITLSAPKAATIEEIKEVEAGTIQAAERVFRAGFDGVEVNANMSYFTSSFVIQRTNWRTDEYGGPLENRARILINIVRGIRAVTSPDFIIGLRIPANDFLPDGAKAVEFATIAKIVEAEGIDYVALTYGAYETMDRSIPMKDGEMAESGDARVFRKMLSVPIFIQGFHNPELAAKAIAEGHGDVVMLARQLLAEPNYVNKLQEGKTSQIVACDRDQLCMRRMFYGLPVRCSMNPEMGREARIRDGKRRPLKRYFQAPLEHLILLLTAKKWFMTPLMKIVRKILKKIGY
ncbi:NADH:flavin oxidoreductase [Chitinophaga sancti]|uniref:NADH:flavin oxidoreductase n=1 Tax=Chitinophaga sancti TaxID=1004 RepID=UPI002A762E64|nr:NADH:flavin oxidoreductase [Chitinophaga sancti]WPQ61757.1 NADH:flavin oxidoreductase [Chitinophaga sancti]